MENDQQFLARIMMENTGQWSLVNLRNRGEIARLFSLAVRGCMPEPVRPFSSPFTPAG